MIWAVEMASCDQSVHGLAMLAFSMHRLLTGLGKLMRVFHNSTAPTAVCIYVKERRIKKQNTAALKGYSETMQKNEI